LSIVIDNDSFIDSFEFADDNLVVGVVLKFLADFTKPKPKFKRFIIAGIDDAMERAALVLINTDFPALRSLAPYQIHIIPEGREEYVDHECFIDCSRFYYYSMEFLRNLIANNKNVVLGKVEDEDSKEIKRLLTASELIKPKEKTLFHFEIEKH
jgi:hypothetical protein